MQIIDAVFYYKARDEHGRWAIGISTPDQRDVAWKYGNNNVLVMDGTFGVSTKKVLCFIVHVVDENNRGNPCAYFVFSPKTGQEGVAGAYDTEILRMYLQLWRDAVEERYRATHPGKSAVFSPKVCGDMYVRSD